MNNFSINTRENGNVQILDLKGYLDAHTTPELEKFAKEAVLFESGIAHASWTKPSVASLMTSRLPSRQ